MKKFETLVEAPDKDSTIQQLKKQLHEQNIIIGVLFGAVIILFLIAIGLQK